MTIIDGAAVIFKLYYLSRQDYTAGSGFNGVGALYIVGVFLKGSKKKAGPVTSISGAVASSRRQPAKKKRGKIGFARPGSVVSSGAPRPHVGQRAILDLPGRFKIAVCGRTFGKTVVGIIAASELIESARDRRILWVSPIKDQSRRVLSEFIRWLGDDVGPGKVWTYRRAAGELNNDNGGTISFLGAESEDSLRGPAVDLIIIDEAADIPEHVWKLILLPMLLARNGKAILLGTPRGTSNWLHGMFMQAQSGKTNWSSYRAPSMSNPAVTAEAVSILRGELTENEFLQEIMAEFIDSGSAVFPMAQDMVGSKIVPMGKENERYATGIDLGRVKDFTVVASFRPADNHLVGFDRFNGMPWPVTCGRILSHLRLFKGYSACDATGVGDAVYEELRRLNPTVFPVVITTDSRMNLIQSLAVAWEHRRFRIAPVPELLNELKLMEWKSEDFGGYTRHVPRSNGQHDDCVFALALAWYARGHYGDAPSRFPMGHAFDNREAAPSYSVLGQIHEGESIAQN